jgi:hypothetical protein
MCKDEKENTERKEENKTETKDTPSVLKRTAI